MNTYDIKENDLSADEKKGLRELKKIMPSSIPDNVRDTLIKKGYVAQKLGGLQITEKGTLYSMMYIK